MTTVKRKSKQLGQILIELGYIKPEQLEVALEEHRKTPKSLGRVLIDLGMIKESDLVRALAEQVGLEFVDLADFQIDSLATSLLPEALARRYRALPIGERDGRLIVAMSDPANVYALDDIRTITGRDVRSRSTRGWTPRSRRWPASWPMPPRRTTKPTWTWPSRTRRSSSS
jgi:type IV pilus assembly protein PilB